MWAFQKLVGGHVKIETVSHDLAPLNETVSSYERKLVAISRPDVVGPNTSAALPVSTL